MNHDLGARRTSGSTAVATVLHGEIETLRLERPEAGVPNNLHLSVVLMRDVVEGDAEAILALYEANGWRRVWTWTVFDWQHYHPNAHEALTVASGEADIQLGGPSGPILTLRAGDAVVLPAGVGHCRVAASDNFSICGGYPPEQVDRVVTRAGDMPLSEAQAQIAALGLPSTDPIHGANGPTVRLWQKESPHGA